MKMLEREITVPLDIQFASPLDIKEFRTEFFTILQIRMEQAHEMAREHIKTEMLENI